MGIQPPGMMGGPANMIQRGTIQGMAGRMGSMKADPVSDAEAALKKLRANPHDKRATEALERALKRLKEQEKQDPPSQGHRNIQ